MLNIRGGLARAAVRGRATWCWTTAAAACGLHVQAQTAASGAPASSSSSSSSTAATGSLPGAALQRPATPAPAWGAAAAAALAFGAAVASTTAAAEPRPPDRAATPSTPAATAAAAAAAAAAAPPPAAAAAAEEEEEAAPRASKLLPLRMRKRIFFKYEKRIREMSTLEKIFDYFATHVKDGARHMDARDVVRALVPTYPPHASDVERAGYLDGEHRSRTEVHAKEHSIFQRIDANHDGFVSFGEFVLVTVMLSIPETDVQTIFRVVDTDDSGTIDADEFERLLALLERRTSLQTHYHSRVGKATYDADGVAPVMDLLFGRNKHVNLRTLQAFLSDLHSDLVALEFFHYDTDGNQRIDGIDFGYSMVTSADINAVDRLLDRVEAMPPDLASARFTLAEFASFDAMRRRLHEIKVALNFSQELQRPLHREAFAQVVARATGRPLPPRVVDLVMWVFGDERGQLDAALFVDCAKRRLKVPGTKGSHVVEADDKPAAKGFPLWWACVKKCAMNDDEEGGS